MGNVDLELQNLLVKWNECGWCWPVRVFLTFGVVFLSLFGDQHLRTLLFLEVLRTLLLVPEELRSCRGNSQEDGDQNHLRNKHQIDSNEKRFFSCVEGYLPTDFMLICRMSFYVACWTGLEDALMKFEMKWCCFIAERMTFTTCCDRFAID